MRPSDMELRIEEARRDMEAAERLWHLRRGQHDMAERYAVVSGKPSAWAGIIAMAAAEVKLAASDLETAERRYDALVMEVTP